MIPLLPAAWASLLVAASALPVPLAGFLYVFGSVICHQISERSFHVDGAQLPVCARCLGIYLGVALGSAIGYGVRGQRARWLVIASAVPSLLTVALEAIGLWYPSNVVRATAGAPLGAAIAFVVSGAAATLHYDSCVRRQPIASRPRTLS